MGFNDVFMRSIEDGFSLLSVGQDKLLGGRYKYSKVSPNWGVSLFP